jgi:hypothetical protein
MVPAPSWFDAQWAQMSRHVCHVLDYAQYSLCFGAICRSLTTGLLISMDYKISLWGIDEVSFLENYLDCMNYGTVF